MEADSLKASIWEEVASFHTYIIKSVPKVCSEKGALSAFSSATQLLLLDNKYKKRNVRSEILWSIHVQVAAAQREWLWLPWQIFKKILYAIHCTSYFSMFLNNITL